MNKVSKIAPRNQPRDSGGFNDRYDWFFSSDINCYTSKGSYKMQTPEQKKKYYQNKKMKSKVAKANPETVPLSFLPERKKPVNLESVKAELEAIKDEMRHADEEGKKLLAERGYALNKLLLGIKK